MSDTLSVQDESTARRIAAGIARLGQVARGQIWRGGGDGPAVSALNPTQAQILFHLGRHGRRPVRPAAVAAELGITTATASDSIAALSAKGLVAKGPVVGDGRGVALALTAAGEDATLGLSQQPNSLADAAAALPAAEQETLLRLLVALMRDLQERGAIPVARICASCRYFRPYAHADAARPHHCAFVDAPFGDGELRLDCADHEAAPATAQADLWRRFTAGARAVPSSP